ncbi:MAG: Glutaredoxin 4 [Holosporales bacterium]
MSDLFEQFKKDISENNIVLYMKGTKDSPKCGFSTAVVRVLENLGLEFKDVDVMEDDRIREGIKQFTNWPTLPQLYIKGEFIGGCDIVRELYKNSELQEILKKHELLV